MKIPKLTKIKLSVYKSENIKSEKEKEQASQIAHQLFDLKHRFNSQLKILPII